MTADERRIERRRNQPTGLHWSVWYWRIFLRFYRARKALLEWDFEKSLSSCSVGGGSSMGSSPGLGFHY